MARQIYNVRPDDSVPAVGLRNKLELDSMRKCWQNRILLSFGHLERIKANS